MRLAEARAAAAEWVARVEQREPGFRGAYLSGSTVGLPDEAELPATSDVDIMVVVAGSPPPAKLGKFRYRDVLLEVTYLPAEQLASAERVLAAYHLAGGFRTDTVIADPTGALRALQARVSREFADPVWVRRRYENAMQGVESKLNAIDAAAPWHDQVLAWLFGTGVTTHIPLVAALRNPTVRLRYLAAREVLVNTGHADLYQHLLALLGCADLPAGRVEEHVTRLATTFDAAASVATTPFFFSSDVTAAARPIAIDGSRDLIRAGWHREATFWIVATFARCHAILAADATPRLRRLHAPAFDAVLADLGIESTADLTRRAGAVIALLPRLRQTAEAILATRGAAGVG